MTHPRPRTRLICWLSNWHRANGLTKKQFIQARLDAAPPRVRHVVPPKTSGMETIQADAPLLGASAAGIGLDALASKPWPASSYRG